MDFSDAWSSRIIAEQNIGADDARSRTIFDAVERGDLVMFDAIKAIAAAVLDNPEVNLFFEIVAESCRNPSVAERLRTLTEFYRDGIGRLAALARPDTPPEELDAYVDLMMACFIGLFYRPAIGAVADREVTSHNLAFLMMRALGQPIADIGSSTRSTKASGSRAQLRDDL